MQHRRGTFTRTLAFLVLMSIVSACSGGSHNGSPSVLPIVATSAPSAGAAAPAQPANATLKIAIPTVRSAAKRRPAYVSPATQSISIAQNGAAPQTLSLAVNSPNCTTAAGLRTCTLSFAAASGPNQRFRISIFASTDGSGAALATQTIVQTMYADGNNVLSVTLDGVVASLSLSVENPTMTTGTASSTTVVLNGLDAAGAIIVGPGPFVDTNGDPIVVTLADSDTSGATHLATTTASSAATVALTYTGAAIANVTISAAAPAIAVAQTTLGFRTSGAALTPDRVNAALTSTQNYYATLPHTDAVSDLGAVATEMVNSGAYAAATVTAGGISATLPDGSPAFVFADRVEDLSPTYATSAARRMDHDAGSRKRQITNDPIGPHSIVFLTNFLDTRAFNVGNQNAFATAYRNAGYVPPNFSITSGEITLDNIVSIGNLGKLDLLDIATHGGVRTDAQGFGFYVLASDTPINASTTATYASDISAGHVVASTTLTASGTRTPTYSFTIDFLTQHATFNPGAILINESCFGGSPIILPTISQTLQAAGVGRYFGWTKTVGGDDADDTDAFIADRLLGETGDTPTGLATFVTQRVPAQRAFPLDDIDGALSAEMRSDPLVSSNLDYAESDHDYKPVAAYPPTSDGTLARLVISDFGGETVSSPIDEYEPPSIESIAIDEPSSTMTIAGSFPGTQGSVLVETSGGGVQEATVTSWTSTSVEATLPASGPGSAGNVTVLSYNGISSNAVPLTQWTGRLYYHETDSIPDLGGVTGTGNGTLDVKYTLDVRADVHPTVATIDTAPVAQNFAFDNPEADSTASLFNYTGDFISSDGKVVADFSLPAAAGMIPSEPPLSDGTFEVRGYTEQRQPSPCNNGAQGPEGDAGNVLCPITGWLANESALACADSGQNSGCQGSSIYDTLGSYGAGFDAGGLLSLTMDPATYRVAVSAPTTSFFSFHFESNGNGDRNATGSMNGSFDAPSFAPTYSIPATSSRPRGGNARRDLSPHARAFVPMPTSWTYAKTSARETAQRIGVRPALPPAPTRR